MSRITRDGMAEPVSRDLRRLNERGQGNIHVPCSADHKEDWKPYTVDPYSAISDNHSVNNMAAQNREILVQYECYSNCCTSHKE